MRARVLATIVLVGCGYRPGSFNSPLQKFSGSRTTAGCLDITVDRRHDLANGEVVVAFSFGNRCDHPTLVDLAAAVVTGRTTEDRKITLTASDPRGEIAPLRIDARAVGGEAIAYVADASLREVCIDAASIAHAESTAWTCFPSPPEVP